MTEVIPEGCLWDLGEPAFVDSDAEPNDVTSDVLIVGAGFTGLWTAYYLRELAPHLSITILEKHRIGFGASGRNGGWASALLPMSVQSLVTHHGVEATRSTFATMNAAVDEIVGHGRAWGIGDTISKGGWIQLARSAAQLDRLYEQVPRSDARPDRSSGDRSVHRINDPYATKNRPALFDDGGHRASSSGRDRRSHPSLTTHLQ
ncbi:MAG: FAD-binding oxidoreductase [Acidimicrobiia bacterium]|nr:FAD-binding oxidoreductase [Acidimicrobiia bacterium]